MEESQNQQKKKQIRLMIIGVAILVIGLVGITYAFFNYTRTGASNVIKTGRIYFNAEQDAAVTLSDLFPITTNGNVTSQTPGVGSLSIHVTGDTSYSGGVEYLVKAVNVTGNNGTNLPISISIGYVANNEKTIGTEDEDYFTNRGGATSRYKVLSTDTIEEGTDLVVGYIAPDNNGTGIDGNIIIMAYLDARNIAITDTYPEQTVRTVITTNYSSSNCETALTGVQDASTYCATASSLQDAIDNNDLTSEQIRLLVVAGIVDEYIDGTTSSWVNERTVFTTAEWNALQASGVSFQVKVEANEGIWVDEPVEQVAAGTIPSCPGCKFMYTENTYNYGINGSTITDVESNNDTLVDSYTTLNKNVFLGFIIENDVIAKAYVCGIKPDEPNQGTAFCLNALENSASAFEDNGNLITGSTLWDDSDETAGRCSISSAEITCSSGDYGYPALIRSDSVYTYSSTDYAQCTAEDGEVWCGEPG